MKIQKPKSFPRFNIYEQRIHIHTFLLPFIVPTIVVYLSLPIADATMATEIYFLPRGHKIFCFIRLPISSHRRKIIKVSFLINKTEIYVVRHFIVNPDGRNLFDGYCN